MGWGVRAIRGATTVDANTESAICQVVTELLDELSIANEIDPTEIVYVVFTATPDVDAMFPAAIARQRRGWDLVPLLDVQQMVVPGSLTFCIRVLIQFNTPRAQAEVQHVYLRGARSLRPDLSLSAVGIQPQ